PARLIDLIAHGEGSRDAALVDTGGKECPVYVTLSYCWGKDPDTSHTTTAERLAAHQKCIVYDELPLTLQHALDITRQLGVRYIWIDGLCIVQGTKEDWERESSKMYAIYRNSFVTIAADSSPETTAGCFNKSSTNFDSLTKPVRISGNLSDRRVSSLYIGKTVETTFAELSLDFERTIVDRCALATRGWAFQERIMSPRVLHYTDRQVFWECNRGLLGEDNLWGHRHYRVLELSKNTDKRKVFDQWLDLVKQYSQRHLTQPADKLPAISGLARIFCKRLSSRYLAGLWFDGLHRGLAWARHGPVREVPLSYRCPSFSWAYL
ncbi:HET-domain-containing protein, partial [Stipitochalara longipes BDJ]